VDQTLDRLAREPSNQLSNNRHVHQRTLTDSRPQIRRTAALAVRTATWLRDEEAAGDSALRDTYAAPSRHVLVPLWSVILFQHMIGAADGMARTQASTT
jgi:hypothetical protein